MRVLLWKVCSEALPTLASLRRRRSDIDSECTGCGVETETIRHVLIECHFARQFWALSQMPWQCLSDWQSSAADWVFQVLQRLDGTDAVCFCGGIWKIWQDRCCRVMEGKTQSPAAAWHELTAILDGYQAARRSTRFRHTVGSTAG
ncbi:hypothetical protein Salat_1154200 [Sesamum alatum]|uniref:Reverse transcriptase zinc-binding domain-containing protein n=1 Tax=Sesamum alatum TaxID=300844 RepID=A0AAE1YE55_9LAMI|nr:hypothetical protein Salat_1154200 [Sesamum alatum]